MSFQEEEELRKTLEDWGRQHDCREAGCEMNPKGENIPDGEPQKRKRIGLKRVRELWEKIHGYPYPG